MVKRIAILFLVFGFFTNASAQPNYTLRIEEPGIPYPKEHSSALYAQGYNYYVGHEVASDAKKAMDLFRQAAKAGDADANVALGTIYLNGVGTEKDISRAISYFKAAEKKQHPQAYYEMGKLYYYGKKISDKNFFPDMQKAVGYFDKAARLNVLPAILRLGNMFVTGDGVSRDYHKALAYFQRAGKMGDERLERDVAELSVQLYVMLGEGAASNTEALEWFKKAAENGNGDAQLAIARAYMNGDGVEASESAAREWFEKAAENGMTDAYNQLAYMYTNGIGAEQDYAKAMQYYTRAAEQGNADAAWNIGNFYLYGYGVSKNRAEADKWFARSQTLRKKR